MTEDSNSRLIRGCVWALLAFVVLRLFTLGIPALIDTTEGRYAAVIREMFVDGNEVMLQIPMPDGWHEYWGKPPFSFWMGAASISLFGTNEFAVRFPAFLSALLMCGFTWLFANRYLSRAAAWVSVAVLISSVFFFFLSGACTIDLMLASLMSGVMYFLAPVLISRGNSKIWAWLAALFLALAVLNKGLIAIVLCGGSVLFWLLMIRCVRPLAAVPWISCSVLFLAVSIPWFIAAEEQSSGFLRYFFINEHFLRYTTENYADRYGMGHVYPYGSSVVLMLLAFMPWSAFLIYGLCSGDVRRQGLQSIDRHVLCYCISWGVFPALFFCLARQITPLYILPGLPGVSLLMAQILEQGMPGIRLKLPRLATIIVVVYAVILLLLSPSISGRRSTGPVIAHVRQELIRETGGRMGLVKLGVLYDKPFSAYFYDDHDLPAGLHVVPLDPEQLAEGDIREIIVRKNRLKDLPEDVRAAFSEKARVGWFVWLRR